MISSTAVLKFSEFGVLKFHFMEAGCMRAINNPFPGPGADNVHRLFGLVPPREEAP